MPKLWVNLKELGMLIVNKFKETLLDYYYLDEDGVTVRYKKNGYYNRYKKDDIVVPFKMHKLGILGVHVPKQRATVPLAHLILLLNNICIPDNYVEYYVGSFKTLKEAIIARDQYNT